PHLADMTIPKVTPVDLIPEDRLFQQLRHIVQAHCQALSSVDTGAELRSWAAERPNPDVRARSNVRACSFQRADHRRIGPGQNLVIRIDKGNSRSARSTSPSLTSDSGPFIVAGEKRCAVITVDTPVDLLDSGIG